MSSPTEKPESEAATLLAWLEQLQSLQTACRQGQITIAQEQYQVVHQVYQTQIVTSALLGSGSQNQRLLTEIHRRLRLLETQFLFLKAARSPAKQQQQQTLLVEHLSAILEFGQAILAENR
ncbi:MAG: heterocyst frequency control protein PatD [Cyanobacteria bacterium P01_G01_bin.54]